MIAMPSEYKRLSRCYLLFCKFHVAFDGNPKTNVEILTLTYQKIKDHADAVETVPDLGMLGLDHVT